MNTLPENCTEEKALTIEESSRLKALEKAIKASEMAFIERGLALEEIRESRLYRTKSNRTWEGYCREVWDMSHRHADRLISAGHVFENLGPIVVKMGPIGPKVTPIGVNSKDATDYSLLPANESQARELTILTPDEQRFVWQQLLVKKSATADSETPFRITGQAVTKAVAEYKGKKFQERVERARKTIGTKREDFRSEEFTSAWDNFLLQIEEERRSNWRNASRKVVFDLLASLAETVGEAGKVNLLKPSVDYQLLDLEKLKAAGLSIYRIRQRPSTTGEAELTFYIEQWGHDDSWQFHDDFASRDLCEEAFALLMKEPTNIQA